MADSQKVLPETDAEIIKAVGEQAFGEDKWQRKLAAAIGRNQAFIYQVMHKGRLLDDRDWRQLHALCEDQRSKLLLRFRKLGRAEIMLRKKVAEIDDRR